MRIGIDATQIGISTEDRGGVYHYVLYLIQALRDIDRENEYVLSFTFFRRKHFANYQEVRRRLGNGGDNFKVVLSRCPNLLLFPLRLPIDFFTGSLDVFHGPAHFVAPVFSGKAVVTIHDFDFLRIPHCLDSQWVKFKDKYTRLSVQRAAMIIAVSHFMKDEIVAELGVQKDKVRVVYHGVSPKFIPIRDERILNRLREKYQIKDRYILFVGGFNPNKNLLRLLEGYRELSGYTTHDYCLVITGTKKSIMSTFNVIMQKVYDLGLQKRIIFTGYVSDEELPALYSGADFFIFPSIYEGFGMPVVEAMACGTPVITSNVCSLPEVAGDAALLVDPYSSSSIAEGMHKLLLDNHLRKDLVSRGFERAKLFTWEKTARETLKVYKEVCFL